MKKIIKNNKGYSLLEMMVAIAMFSVVFLLITSTYLSLVESQRNVITTQNIQESMKFVFELIGKEIRTAQKSDNTCSLSANNILPATHTPNTNNKIFNTAINGTDTIFYFMNKYDKCVSYRIINDAGVGRLAINREGVELFLTPDELNLENLNFVVWDDLIGAFHSRQPYITFRVDVESARGKSIHNQRTTLQTSVASRYYE